MHVAVLGAGVIGVTSAHYLIEAGHTVTLIEREDSVASGTSFANGAQLSYSFTDAMANPGFILAIPALLAGMDPAIKIRPGLDPAFARWAMSFLGQCTRHRARENTLAILKLAMRSQQLMQELRAGLPGDFHFRAAGKIVLLRSAKEVASAHESSELKARYDCEASVISIERAHEIEPAIRHMTGPYLAAVYSPRDEVGDACAFTTILAEKLLASGRLTLSTGTLANKLVTKQNRVCRVETSRGDVEADAFVACLGAWSGALLKPLGIETGIYPNRGYSVTFPSGEHSPAASVSDLGKRIVISRLGARTRVAGFSDFVGYDTRADAKRIQALTALASQCAPAAADYSASPDNGWGGFRPLTASGRPLTAASCVDGLFLNTGHGSLGWTLACASAMDLANAVTTAKRPGSLTE